MDRHGVNIETRLDTWRVRTKELLVLCFQGRNTRLELVATTQVHLVLLLHLPEAVDGLADESLCVRHAPTDGHNILVREGGNGLVGVDGIELGKDLAELFVLLGECTLLYSRERIRQGSSRILARALTASNFAIMSAIFSCLRFSLSSADASFCATLSSAIVFLSSSSSFFASWFCSLRMSIVMMLSLLS